MSLKLCLISLLVGIAISAPKAKETLTFSGKVLVTTGFGLGDGTTSEVIDVKDPSNKCQNLPNYPINVDGANAGLFQDKYPLICGGSLVGVSDCYMYNPDIGDWEFKLETYNERYRGGHVMVFKGSPVESLWISGGLNADYERSEFVDPEDGVSPGPNLPVGLYSHCMLDIGNQNYMVIGGGLKEKYVTEQVYFYDMKTFTWTPGPKLAYGRVEHSCGLLMNPDGRMLAAVVGGIVSGTPGHTDSVELLEIDVENGMIEGAEWMAGPNLPVGLGNHDSVVVDNTLYTFGGDTEEGFNQVVYQLSYNEGTWQWSTWGETAFPRWLLVAMQIPDELVQCEK